MRRKRLKAKGILLAGRQGFEPRSAEPRRRLVGPEMSLGKRAAGAGLQVPLKPSSRRGVRELERDHERPRTVGDSHARRTGVVPFEPSVDVTRETDVVAIDVGVAAEDVDKAFGDAVHVDARSTVRASVSSARFRGRFTDALQGGAEKYAVLVTEVSVGVGEI